MWRVAGPSEYLAITGGFIKEVKLTKKAWIWPTQKCFKFHVSPVNYTFEAWAMTAEKLPFFLPAVFTIGPRFTDHKSLLLYAKLFVSHVKPSVSVKDLVESIIEGQTCVVATSMTMKHMFKEVLEKLQLKLNQFGLVIYSAYLVDAAMAKMMGTVDAGQTKTNAAKIDLDTGTTAMERQGKLEIEGTRAVKIFKNQMETGLAEANAHLSHKEGCMGIFCDVNVAEAQKATAQIQPYMHASKRMFQEQARGFRRRSASG